MHYFSVKVLSKFLMGLVIITSILSTPLFSFQGIRKQKILVLHSYHQGLEWTDSITKGIQSVFKPLGHDFEVYYEYLDTKRNVGDLYYRKLMEYHATKLKNNSFSVMIVADNIALQFIQDYGASLYTDIPIVFCGINNFRKSMIKGIPNITGIAENLDHKSTIQLMLKLHPDAKKILVLGDKTITGLEVMQNLKSVVPLFKDKVQFEYLQDFLLEDLGDKIASYGKEYLIYILTISRDREEKFISYSEAMELVNQASQVPVYGSWDFYFGKGLVGGRITSGELQGQKAAEYALRIARGEKASEIPIMMEAPTKYMFDYDQLKRFGIDHSLLPVESEIIHTPPSFYERYQSLLLKFTVFSLFLIFILIWHSIYQKRKQKMLANLNSTLDRQVEKQTAELRSALENIKTLKGLIPICTKCKKIRDDQGYWNRIEDYLAKHTDASFSHGLCSKCEEDIYSKEDWYRDWKNGN